MGSRIREDVKHFFECFFEVVPPSEEKEAWIIQKFPENYKDEEVLKSVTNFAYPCEFENETIQHYSFVLTNIDSKWTFGFCRHDPKTETALVVLSYLPWHKAFYKFLNDIAVLTQSPKSEQLWDFLSAVYKAKVPAPGFPLQVKFNDDQSTFICQSPSQFQLPSIPDNKNLTEYYNAVDSHNMMVIFASMLYERRIIFTSKKLARLSACVQSANDVIYPMIWQHIFIPVLPMTLKDYLLAPMPFLIGVPSAVFKKVRKSDIGDVVILDADNNTIETPFNDLETLPPEIVSSLKRQLRNRSALLGDGVSRAFLRALVQLIGGYRDALKFQTGKKITFNPEAFIESRSTAMQPFLRKMLQLQIFQQFIEERLDMLNKGLGFSDEFEMEASNYSEKSSSKLKQQYKEFVKNVKDKTNPAMKSAVKSVKEGGKGMKSAYKGLRSKFRESQGAEELETDMRAYSRQTVDKPRSAPNSPTSRRRQATTITYRKPPVPNLKPEGRGNTANYSPLNPPSNPRTPDSPDFERSSFHLAPLDMDLLHELQQVLNDRIQTDERESTPPVDRSLKPVRSLESFKNCTKTTQANNVIDWWQDSAMTTVSPMATKSNERVATPLHRSRSGAPAATPFLHNDSTDSSNLLLDSSDYQTSSLLDMTDNIFASPPPIVPPRKPSANGKDLFGATPFVIGGGQSENGDAMFLVASPNSVDLVKLSPPSTFSTRNKKDASKDLIRLDSTPSDGIDDFDPLLSKDRNQQPTSPTIQVPSTSQRSPPEIGLSNPLYPYYVPPMSSSAPVPFTNANVLNPLSKTFSNKDQDLLHEYGLDFNKFGFSVENGDKTTSNSNNDPFDPFGDTNVISKSKPQNQWTKFE